MFNNGTTARGFSLIELLITVVILAIIAAIAIPNLLAARRSSNEGSAISSLRILHSAQMTYVSTFGANQRYGSLADLGNAQVGMIDAKLASGARNGYLFTLMTALTPKPAFAVVATPLTPTGVTATGTRDFGMSEEGVMKSSGVGGMSSNAGVLTGGDVLAR